MEPTKGNKANNHLSVKRPWETAQGWNRAVFRKYMFAKFPYILPCSGKPTMYIERALENLVKTAPKVRFLHILAIKPIFSKHFHVMRAQLLTGTVAGHPGFSLFPLDDRREERQGGSKKGRLRGCGEILWGFWMHPLMTAFTYLTCYLKTFLLQLVIFKKRRHLGKFYGLCILAEHDYFKS